MAGISNYLGDIINDWLHRGTAWTPPATTYFALMTTLPTAIGGGVEVSGGSYARLSFTNNSTNWPASSGGNKSNGVAMTWVTPTADWGLVVGVAEYDASSGGNLLTFAPLNSSVTVLNGQAFSLPVGGAVFTWSGSISQYLVNKLNDWLHGGGAFTVPDPTYFGLMTTAPTQTTAGTETSGTSYARVNEANNSTDWPVSAGQSKANSLAMNWPTAGAGGWSGPEVGVAEYDASSGGNILTFGSLSTSVTVNSGGQPSVPAGGAVYTVS
jgi:hypothetical protein